MKQVPDKPTVKMIAAAMGIIELEDMPIEAKRVGAAVVMALMEEGRIKPHLEGEAVLQAAQLYMDYQIMVQASQQ